MKKPFLDRPYDYTRTPRTSEFIRGEEYHTGRGHFMDTLIALVSLFAFGFIAGLAVAGVL